MKLAELHHTNDLNAACLGCETLLFVSPIVREHTREIECTSCGKRSNIEKAMARIAVMRKEQPEDPRPGFDSDIGVGAPG